MEGIVQFTCKGHPNILGNHKNTFEFTKDKDLSLKGDCIIGVSCDFDSKQLIDFAKENEEFILKLDCNGLTETVRGRINKHFSDEHELVFRLGDFSSERTFGIKSDKSAKMLDKKFVNALKTDDSILLVKLYSKV